MLNRSLCEGCPIAGAYRPIEAKGPTDARFLIVTDVPSQAAGKEDRLLTDKQMGTLAGELLDQGFERGDFRFTPVCHCAYDPNLYTNKTKTAIHKHCRQHFLAEVAALRPDVVVPLGAEAATHAFGRATKITKVRGMAHDVDGLAAPIFPLLSPGLVVKYPQNAPLFRADVESFCRYVGAGYDSVAANDRVTGDYRFIEDLDELLDENPEVVAFDMEATGLRWYKRGVDVRTYRPELHKGKSFFDPRFQILTMQFTTQEGTGFLLPWDHPERPIPERHKPHLRNQLRKLLCDPERLVVGQNVKFDNVALWMTEGIRFRIGGDTLMLVTLDDENATEKNLDVMTKIHVPEMAGYADVFNATYDKSRMWEVPIDKMLAYGVGDTDAAFRLYMRMEEKIAQDDGQWAHYCHVSIPGLNALAAMESRGMFVDQDHALSEFKTALAEEVAEMEADLLSQIDRRLKRDVVQRYTEKNKGAGAAEKALSFSRVEFMKELLFTHPYGFRLKPKVFTDSTKNLKDVKLREPSTSAKDHLPYFFEECPFTETLAEYKQKESLLTKSVISFEKKYIVGGKVRPNYHLTRAVTGRTSSDDPNGQNYPKRGKAAKAYRKMFVAPEGYFVAELDLSQAELRIAACMANDKTMIDIYRRAGDIHTATALIVMGVTAEQFKALPKQEQKDARTKAKAVNFGFLYGMGWKKFIGYAKTQYGAEFTEEEAQRVRANFFRLYRGLPGWHEKMRDFAASHGYVRSFSGRIRHLPMINSSEDSVKAEAMRQAINSPVQEFGSSLGVMALGRMNEEIDPEYLQFVGFIHDAIVVYIRKEYLDWGMRTVKRYMQTNPLEEWFGTKLQVPIVADCGFGLNLGEIIECEGFDLDKPFDYTSLKDKETGKPLIVVPRQKVPPNGGMLQRSAYTTPDDLEDEDAPQATTRHRIMRGAVTQETVARISRSEKQMVINKRNREAKREEPAVTRRVSRTAR